MQAAEFPCYKASLNENSVQNKAVCAGLRRKEIFSFSSVMQLEICREIFLSLLHKDAPKTSKLGSSATCKLQVSIFISRSNKTKQKKFEKTTMSFSQN